jgi:hypothetical protein
MNANATRTAASTRIAGFFFAIVASTLVLGATVGGMQASDTSAPQMLALDSVTVEAVKAN